MRAVIIANPLAGGYTPELVDEVADRCRPRFDAVTTLRTTALGDATRFARSISDGSIVLCVGGDGTAREVVHGLAGRDATMFIVPAGTANSCYRSFWGELPWAEALDLALADPRARRRMLDLARLSETRALVLAGACTGFPPQAIHLASTLRDLTGRARYEHALVELAKTFRPYPGRVTVDGEIVHSGLTMLANVGGSRYRGGQFEVLPHSVIDDGLLDVCVIGGEHDPAEMLTLARAGEHVLRPGVTYARGRRITIERTDTHPVWFEHDGEVLPHNGSRFTLEVVPHAVPMFVGPTADLGRRAA